MPEVEYSSWFSRLGKSVGGVLVGAVLFLVSFPLLFWNEGRAVHRAQTLSEGASACVDAPSDKVESANEGKLVHVSAEATTPDTVTDPVFGVSAKALKLTRHVEIYQWVQRSESKTEKKLGGGETTTTYYYHDKKWVNDPVDSNNFKPDDGPYKGQTLVNVGSKPYLDATERAKEVKLGAYALTAAQVDRIGSGEKLPVTKEMLARLPSEVKDRKWLVSSDGYFYLPFGAEDDPSAAQTEVPSTPQVGDVRVYFTQLKPQPVSVMARQVKGSFEPWVSPSRSGNLDELRPGTLSKEAMFQQAVEENNLMTWVLRLVGFALMAFGIYLVFAPLVTFADVLPFLGDLMGMGVGVFAILIALPLSLITIALGWLVYRPLLGVGLLVGAGLLLAGVIYLANRARAAKLAAKAHS